MKRYAGIIVFLLIVGVMVLLLVNNKQKMREQAEVADAATGEVPVESVTLQSESYTLNFDSNGILQAESELNYVSDVSGRVVELLVDKGTYVRKGDPLLKIDKELLEADYVANKAAYEALRKDEQRFARSSEAGGVTLQQLDNLRTQLTVAESRMIVSHRRLDDATVKSPMEGVVNQRYVELGSLIAPNAPLFDIVNDTRLKVICNVSETKVRNLSKNQKVVISTSTVPGAQFSGRINYVGIKTDRGLNYPVEVLIDKNEELRIGMYVKVGFMEGQARTGLLVPRKAVIGSVKSAHVYVIRQGKAMQCEVILGEMIGDRVEVISGLNVGDQVIVSGLMNVANGTLVRSLN